MYIHTYIYIHTHTPHHQPLTSKMFAVCLPLANHVSTFEGIHIITVWCPFWGPLY